MTARDKKLRQLFADGLHDGYKQMYQGPRQVDPMACNRGRDEEIAEYATGHDVGERLRLLKGLEADVSLLMASTALERAINDLPERQSDD